MLGASWGSCIDIGGDRTGLIGGVMNTAGQIGGIPEPDHSGADRPRFLQLELRRCI